MNESQSHLWAIGIIFWYKRKGKYYLCSTAPKLPFESWGAFYVFDQLANKIQLYRRKPVKGSYYQWVTREQILKALQKEG